MGMLEIILLVAGAVIFIVSFLLPPRAEETGKSDKLIQEEIKGMVSREMEGIKGHVEEVVDESISYAVEKTERALERLSNEKIMAINEYSDTVLNEIHKNHEEAVFLYDMLNNKHVHLKDTVSRVNQTVKEAEETTRGVEAAVAGFHSMDKVVPEISVAREKVYGQDPAETMLSREQDVEKESPEEIISFAGTQEMFSNNNEKILELYNQGKSKVAIAKELGLGVGEVKLVIDLNKNR